MSELRCQVSKITLSLVEIDNTRLAGTLKKQNYNRAATTIIKCPKGLNSLKSLFVDKQQTTFNKSTVTSDIFYTIKLKQE